MAAEDLTTLSAVREFLQKQAVDTEQDDVIASLITRASNLIMRYTEREFAPATTSDTRVFDYEGRGWLDLAPYDLRSVSSIQIDTDTSSPTTLTSGTDYRLWPRPAVDGTYLALRLDTPGVYSEWPTRELSITGDWGFASVPSDVAHACIVTVSIWLRRDVAAFAANMNLDEARVERPEVLPSAVKAGLDHYKRRLHR